MGNERTNFVGAAVGAVALCLVLVPIGVNAATDNVVIKDADSQVKAQVGGGKLYVGDGNGPLTVNGSVNVGNLPATQTIAGSVTVDQVDGLVTTTPNFATSTQFFVTTSDQNQVVSFYGPFGPGQRVAWTSMTFINRGTEAAEIRIRHNNPTGATCPPDPSSILQEVAFVMVPGKDTVHLDFPTPIRMDVDGADNYCVVAFQTGGNGEVVSAIRGITYTQS